MKVNTINTENISRKAVHQKIETLVRPLPKINRGDSLVYRPPAVLVLVLDQVDPSKKIISGFSQNSPNI